MRIYCKQKFHYECQVNSEPIFMGGIKISNALHYAINLFAYLLFKKNQLTIILNALKNEYFLKKKNRKFMLLGRIKFATT